jgi:CDGSH-type Zn-finger protein
MSSDQSTVIPTIVSKPKKKALPLNQEGFYEFSEKDMESGVSICTCGLSQKMPYCDGAVT